MDKKRIVHMIMDGKQESSGKYGMNDVNKLLTKQLEYLESEPSYFAADFSYTFKGQKSESGSLVYQRKRYSLTEGIDVNIVRDGNIITRFELTEDFKKRVLDCYHNLTLTDYFFRVFKVKIKLFEIQDYVGDFEHMNHD